MPKINQVRLKQDADKEEKSGRFDKAIDLLKQIVQENPRDWATINRIGDLYSKLNNLKAANEQYVKVARYYADDGFYLKAIAVWKKVLKNDPSMIEGNKELGDLQARQGLPEAKQTLGLVIDEYIKRGKKREAGDVLRRLAEIDPSDIKVRIRLAELYAWEGNPDKAAGEYVAIAEELVKKGHVAEAGQLMEKALRSGPRGPTLLAAAARVALVQKDFARAVERLEEARRARPADREVSLRLAEAFLGMKRPDDARRVLEGLLERDPTDQDARQQLGHVYLAEGRPDQAFEQLLPSVDRLVDRRQIDRGAALLQQIVQRHPAHVRSLAKLVELYRLSRNDMLVAQTYSQMVEAYLGEGRFEQAASILEMLLELEPHNEQHRSKLRWLRQQQGGQAPGFEMDFERAAPPPAPVAAAPPAPPPKPAAIELSGPLSPDDQEFIKEHLDESVVFRKYGLGEKARDHIEAVLARFPDNLEALQALVDLHREKGEKDAAAARLRIMAEVHRLKGDADRAARAEAEAAGLGAPPAVAAAPPPAAPAPAPAPAVAPAAPAPAAPLAAAPPAAAPPASAPLPGRSASRPAARTALPPPDASVEITVDEAADEEAVQEDDALLQEIAGLEPAAPPEPDLGGAFEEGDLAPSGGEIRSPFIDVEEGLAQEGGFDLDEGLPPPPAAVATGLVVPAAPKAAPVGDVPADLRRALEEIQQYVSMGFVEDAKGVLDELGGRFAAHPALVRRLAELGLEAEPSPRPASTLDDLVPGLAPPEPEPAPLGDEPLQMGSDFLEFTPPPPTAAERRAAPPPDGGATDGFDLASELGDLFGAQPAVAAEAGPASSTDLGDASLADIFREFQKGVDKQLGKEDYETRYNLGIAYKEMGLVDEAIAEFQLAAKDGARLLECASMLGICFVEKGMPKLAVKWFEKGLSTPGRTEDEYKGIRYDLADALEQAEEPGDALARFEEVYGQDASFRDVADRIERLRQRVPQRGPRR
ncbi:MAG TPA: tetratricopeptide repeat protein [Vicinamibacteria bacterium]|nr:tetratricopeptide repeat protein [Vicinamibacteria bacterium]